jgi:nucleolar complex protein 3
MDYEVAPRQHKFSERPDNGIQRLPVKLPGGKVKFIGSREGAGHTSDDTSEESDEERKEVHPIKPVDDVSTGARFGRAAVVDIIGMKDKVTRIAAAKEQIAGICQDILSDPENGVRLACVL